MTILMDLQIARILSSWAVAEIAMAIKGGTKAERERERE